MTDPEVFDSLKDAKPPRKPTCKCSRCGKQLYADSCGNFVSDGRGNWSGVCMACLRPEED